MKIYSEKLYDYQKEAIDKIISMPRAILGLGAGLGKTITSLAWLEIHKKINEPTYKWIVCSKAKMDEWVEDYKNEIDENVILLNKSTEKNKELITPFKTMVIGYTAFSLLYKKGYLPTSEGQLMIFDESQKLNGIRSRISTAVMNNKNLFYILLLSGTLHSTGYHNLANQAVILGISPHIYHFEKSYCVTKKMELNGNKFNKIVGYRNINELIERLNTVGFLLRENKKAEKIDKKMFKVKIPKNKTYDVLKRDQVVDDFIAKNPGVLYNSLRMLCSGFLNNDYDEIVKYGNHKQEIFKRLLDEKLHDERVLIFYNYNEELKQIKDVCKQLKRPLSQINGSIHNRKKFYDNENGVIAIQYLAGSEGVDGLQIANNTIYYSPTLSGGLFEQSQKRTDRIGQRNKQVNYYCLSMEDTLEPKIYDNLKEYRDITDNIFKEII